MFYAQLDQEKICIGVSSLSREVNVENMIPIGGYDTSILGKKHENGNWVEIPAEPMDSKPTETEMLMQTITDLELQILETQQGQQLLAQQLTDLELTQTT